MSRQQELETRYRAAVTAVAIARVEYKRADPDTICYVLSDLVDARSARDAAAEALYGSPVVRQGKIGKR
jgi:hypothetical protein